jgi:hypothetical protein
MHDGWAGKERARCAQNPPIYPSGATIHIDMMSAITVGIPSPKVETTNPVVGYLER